MLTGICIDPGQSAVLEKGTRYYLFANGPKHFYVSKFPNQGAHNGCFQAKYFQVSEKEDWPMEPDSVEVALDPEKIYKANLTWRKPGYQFVELKEYYIRPNGTHGFFYHDRDLKKCGGCFPLHWFENFEEVKPEIDLQGAEDSDTENRSMTKEEIFKAVVLHFSNHSWLTNEIENGWIQPTEKDIFNYLSRKIGGEARNGGTLTDEHMNSIGSFQTDRNGVAVDAWLIKGPKYYYPWKEIVSEIMITKFCGYDQLSLFDF